MKILRETRLLLIPVISLFVMGLVMIFNTSSAEVLDLISNKSTHVALVRQICYGLFALGTGFVAYLYGYKRLLERSSTILAILTFLLILVFVPKIGLTANGARRWISIAGISIQPSEFVKFFALLYFVYKILQTRIEQLSMKSFLQLLAPIGVPLFLILIEPNNGTCGVIVLALVVLFFLTKIPFNFWALPIIVAGVIVVGFALKMPYVQARFQVYLHPELDLKGKGHQPYQAKIASGSGGLWGKGPGKSVQKLSYLPEAQNDYIAAIYAEEYGFVGMLVMLLAYSWIIYLGLAIAFDAKDAAGLYIAAGFTFLIGFQAFLNLGVVSGLLPSTGLNLPFFSQGGSSLIGNAIGLGTLLSVAKERN